MPRAPSPLLSVAPMMDHTDRHLRWILRRISRRTLLYTEMVVTHAIRHGDREKLLGFDPSERPLALQLGGDDPVALAECARIAEDMGYDEVDLNVGCPSDRVRSGAFGAVLMRTPEKVADGVAAMRAAVSIPVTVKHRIGVDEADAYEDLVRFVEIVAPSGADRFVVHARKAILGGLSPKQNREIPPLRHADVHRLKVDFPELQIEINGGIKTLEESLDHLRHVDAVMIGRGVIERPMLLADADRLIFGETTEPPTREAIAEQAQAYVERQVHADPSFRPRWVLRHLSSLYAGVPGAAVWRRTLSEREDLGEARAAVAAR
ncbi:MAG: tRNA dihydrouridine(20/20a) synthase DusA [Alphaproteobacteria bacterium]|nr:tRNA dihydrouridine(20/20a) synthase DusA [Alphaproteobacteria bacterium]